MRRNLTHLNNSNVFEKFHELKLQLESLDIEILLENESNLNLDAVNELLQTFKQIPFKHYDVFPMKEIIINCQDRNPYFEIKYRIEDDEFGIKYFFEGVDIWGENGNLLESDGDHWILEKCNSCKHWNDTKNKYEGNGFFSVLESYRDKDNKGGFGYWVPVGTIEVNGILGKFNRTLHSKSDYPIGRIKQFYGCIHALNDHVHLTSDKNSLVMDRKLTINPLNGVVTRAYNHCNFYEPVDSVFNINDLIVLGEVYFINGIGEKFNCYLKDYYTMNDEIYRRLVEDAEAESTPK